MNTLRELILNTPYSQNQRQRPHPFPVVDFKFRNTGNGAAFLTKFNIEILEARVDITPELRFQWELAGDKTSSSVDRSFRRWLGSCGDTLSVLAGNVGWGPALNFHLTFADDLSHLFKRIGKGADSVCDDNFVTVRTLSLEDLDKGCFLIAAERCAAGWRNSLNRPKDELSLFRRRRATPEILKFLDDGVAFVDVDHIQFDWGCSASDGSVYDDSETLSINGGSGLDGSLLLITQESFMYVPGEVLCGAAMMPAKAG